MQTSNSTGTPFEDNGDWGVRDWSGAESYATSSFNGTAAALVTRNSPVATSTYSTTQTWTWTTNDPVNDPAPLFSGVKRAFSGVNLAADVTLDVPPPGQEIAFADAFADIDADGTTGVESVSASDGNPKTQTGSGPDAGMTPFNGTGVIRSTVNLSVTSNSTISIPAGASGAAYANSGDSNYWNYVYGWSTPW